MRLLILTQVVDPKDSALGYYHQWLKELSRQFDRLLVFALRVGSYDLPENVTVIRTRPWGDGRARTRTALSIIALAWKHRREYDAVFVHMNQEYILVAGWLWLLMGKPIYFWRNHYDGDWMTKLASGFCRRVFYTSKFSYNAGFKNAIQMPVGVSVESCHLDEPIERMPHSVLFLGRFDRSKRPDLIVEALGRLKQEGIDFTARFVGGASENDAAYPEEVALRADALGLKEQVEFLGPVPNTDTYKSYRSQAIYVNCGKSGMLDKSLFKSIACGCLALFSSKDMRDMAGDTYYFPEGDLDALTEKLRAALSLSDEARLETNKQQQESAIGAHTLPVLAERIREIVDKA